MRLFLLCLFVWMPVVSSNLFQSRGIKVDLNAGDPATQFTLQYQIYKPDNFKANGPVFYGTAGRESIPAMSSKFDLFNFTSKDFKDAAIVFVDQRFYGDSTQKINTLADLAPLNMKNIVNDHVTLIKFLAGSDQLNSKNFLVFGGGYGGLIAGYVANYFAKTSGLSDYKVLGWSSSSPIKQIRQGTTITTTLDDLSKQFEFTLWFGTTACGYETRKKFGTFFELIKGLNQGNRLLIDGLYLDPKPNVKATGDNVEPTDDQKELAVYVRKQIINLMLRRSLYEDQYNYIKIYPMSPNLLCEALARLPDSATNPTYNHFNDIFVLLGNDVSMQKPLKWKVSTLDSKNKLVVNQDLVVSAYQDCTEQQFAHCANEDTDLFVKSRWNNEKCADINAFDTMIESECQGLFRGFEDLTADFKFNSKRMTNFPVVLNTNVISSVNFISIFAPNDDGKYYADDNGNYAHFFDLCYTDGWELQAPRECDTVDGIKETRYKILRAFACLANLVDVTNKDQLCNKDKLFDPISNRVEKNDIVKICLGITDTCKPDPSAHFPFGYEPLFVSDSTSTVAPADTSKSSKDPTKTDPGKSVKTTTTMLAVTSGSNGFVSSCLFTLMNVVVCLIYCFY